MRILMATHYFASHNGGIELVADQLFRQFTAAGHEVIWMAGDSTPPPPPIRGSRAVPIRVLNSVEKNTGLPFPIPTPAARSAIRAEVEKADMLLLHDCLYLSNIAAFKAAKLREVPTIVVQHIGHVPYKNVVLNAIMKVANVAITRPMLRRASQVIFISGTTKDFFGTIPFRRPPQIIFNGVDADVYRPLRPSETKAALREQFRLPVTRPIILFVGRFVEKKGLAILQRMVALKPDYTWAFAGWGPVDPGKWNEPNVRIFSGLRGESMAALYRACDLLILPSVGEGFPLVVQEALASGLPVVCGAETISADPELAAFTTGVPIDPKSREVTAKTCIDAIEKVLFSEMQFSRAQQRRDFAQRRYSWQCAAQQYLEIAATLLDQRGPEIAIESAGKAR